LGVAPYEGWSGVKSAVRIEEEAMKYEYKDLLRHRAIVFVFVKELRPGQQL
jgi:hypothetical protein